MKSSSLEIWEEMARKPVGGYKEGLDSEKKFLIENLSEDEKVLDIGSGFGRVLEVLSPKVKEIIGIDNDEEAVKESVKLNENNKKVKVLLMDAENLEFSDGEFGIVTCLGGTPSNFGKTRNKIYSEIKRVLKKKGLFFCSVYNEDALKDRVNYYEKYYSGKYTLNKETGYVEVKDKFVSEQFSQDQMKNILNENGFEVLKTIKAGVLNIFLSRSK
ncbi:class I SAM-dependent methyltransferase [archaeon]|nr:class I SAM-dependent methyltransferase [archaeon]PJC45615.1 MAG: hypothetical protein CO037_00695 [Candidatus Pacearchaeota archaeon CG_4_9_14_0_2_um_filter_30_8]